MADTVSFNLWVTLLCKIQAERLSGKLVSSGWAVDKAGRNFCLCVENAPATLCALTITGPQTTTTNALRMVEDLLDELGAHYYSIIITERVDGASSWNLGNIRLPQKTAWDRLGDSAKSES